MTRKELTRNYWRYYRMIEDKFRETIDYVEIATTIFSHTLMSLLCSSNLLDLNWTMFLRSIVALIRQSGRISRIMRTSS
jgi:hypothetical protein